jgi:hypothetical protein
MTISSKKECETFCHEVTMSKIDKLFRKRTRAINNLVEIIARGIAELHQRFDDLEKKLAAHDRVTHKDHSKTK